jgi:hypothetical protein
MRVDQPVMKASFISGLVVVAIVVLSSTGCDAKRAKECGERCVKATETCRNKKEANCDERGRSCGERCERNAEYSF